MAAAQTVQAIEIARSGEVERARAMLAAAEREAATYASTTGDTRLAAQAAQMHVLESALPAMAAPAPGSTYQYADDDARTVRSAHGAAMEMIQTTASD